mmetsp:Transcript_3392/g.9760  ORF Transcript_3392/g.9760 Transcript_3392/m.9760 type:complete len:535 (-) Transcript_3392:70-1674(-)
MQARWQAGRPSSALNGGMRLRRRRPPRRERLVLVPVDGGHADGADGGGEEAVDDHGEDPSRNDLGDDGPVGGRGAALHGSDAEGGAHLAVGGGEGDAEAGAEEHDEHGAELDGEAAGRGDLGNLDTDGVHDLVAVHAEADHDAEAADGEDPVHVVAHIVLLGEGALVLVDEVDRGVGAHGVGHIVGAVGEGVESGGEDLHVLEHDLRLARELLGEVVDVGGLLVLRDDGVHVRLERAAHVADEARGGGLLLRGHRHGGLGRLGSGLIEGLRLHLGLAADVAAHANGRKCDEEASADADTDGDAEVITLRVEADRFVLALSALDEHVHEAHAHGEPHEDGVGLERTLCGVVVAEHKGAGDAEDERREDGGEHRGEHPRHHDGTDAGDVEGLVRGASPVDAGRADGNHGHADHSADGRVRGAHRELEVGGEVEPEARAEADGDHAPHEHGGLADEALLAGDALADGVRHVAAKEDRASELEDRGNDHGVANAEGLGADGRGEGVGNVVGADAEGGEEGEEGANDDHPLILLQRVLG